MQYIQALLERAASRLAKGLPSSALADLQLLAAVAPESAYVKRHVAAMAATTGPDCGDDQAYHRQASWLLCEWCAFAGLMLHPPVLHAVH